VGRAAGAVAGELDRGTMELLLSQPIPRNRLILAHFLADCVVIPALCLSFWAGTQFGLWTVGPFEVDYSTVREVMSRDLPPAAIGALNIPTEKKVMEVRRVVAAPALLNLAALMFALSGLTLRSRRRAAAGGR